MALGTPGIPASRDPRIEIEMNCPAEIAIVILDIIRQGTLRIRAAAANGDAEQCGVEAVHLHNLPVLLEHFSEDFLLHYYRIEIPAFVTRNDERYPLDSFEEAWSKLGKYIEMRRLNAAVQQ